MTASNPQATLAKPSPMANTASMTIATERPEFVAFQSIPRLFRDIVITEKIDGTNAQVHVSDDGIVSAGSRNRWITPDADNFGFAAWVQEHADELLHLGPGSHYGEWWGAGVQRRYGLDHKRFSLFNVSRWADDAVRPVCCHVVPTLYAGPFGITAVDDMLSVLRNGGSLAAPGFMEPEGVCLYHPAAKALFKATLDGDGHKSMSKSLR